MSTITEIRDRLEAKAGAVAGTRPYWDCVAALLDVAEAAGLEHWPTDCPYIGCRVCKALHALDQLLPQREPE